MTGPSGMVLIDKPAGLTSRAVDQQVARRLAPAGRPQRGAPRFRVGHAGTLDPLATGLLLVLVGRGTRLQPFLSGLDKRYATTVRFGAATDSHDRDGAVTATVPVPETPAGLEAAVAALSGPILQEPPVLSALKRGGRSLHRRARAGEDVAPPSARPVHVHCLAVTAVRWGVRPADGSGGHLASDGLVYEVDLDLRCSSGTYVRSLGRDLGRALGTEAHLHDLRRLEIGPFDVADAVALEAFAAAADPSALLLPLAASLPHAPAVTVPAAAAAAIRRGEQPARALFADDVPPLFRLLDPGGALVAVGRYDRGAGLPRTAAVFGPAPQPASADRPGEDDPCA